MPASVPPVPAAQDPSAALRTRPGGLAEVAGLFTRLSLTAFGGPAAHIAMMEDEVVRRRRWITREEFLDRLGAASLIPGPTSTEMVIYLGYLRAGWPGLIVAGVCFIVPAAVMVAGLAWAYVRFGGLPQSQRFLYGLKPVVIAIIAQALWKLCRTAVKTRFLGVAGMASAGAAVAGAGALIVLAGAGLVAGSREWWTSGRRELKPLVVLLLIAAAALAAQFAIFAAPSAQPHAAGLRALFLYFTKIGSVLYGSGYVLLAFLRQDLVVRWHWLTSRQLLDAVAAGQITPGPLFTTGTFIGYLLQGVPGAAVATAGIFVPAFVLCAVSGPVMPWLRKSRLAGAFLDGVNVASLALMALVTWELARTALIDALTVVTAMVSAVLLLRYRVHTGWLILGGVLWGLALACLA
ncbi:MAG: chromate efflux transporter [Bryobacteraceae bacterium]|jgi:chromate transporter